MKQLIFKTMLLALVSLHSLSISALVNIPAFVVTKTTDDGSTGTLRKEMQNVITAGSGIVDIQTSGTITLGSPLPVITAPITIQCSNIAGITISGNNSHVIFEVLIPTGTVHFKDLNIMNGNRIGGGGGINAITSNNGKISFENCTITNCSTTGSEAYGGAIQSTADVDLLNCTLTGNSAVDGGGAIEMLDNSGAAILNINHCTIVNNSTLSEVLAGGVDAYLSKITISNSIVANNNNGNGSNKRDISVDDSNANTNESSFNLYSTAPFIGTNDFVNAATLQLGLATLNNNGGKVKTMAINNLLSLAFNTGNGAQALDARGTIRDGNPDKGAYEVIAPTATTLAATDVTTTTATLNGVYDVKDFDTHSAQFQYGSLTGVYTQTVNATVNPLDLSCTFALASQAPSSKVYYRLAATVAGALFYGAEQTFTLNTLTSLSETNNDIEIQFYPESKNVTVKGGFEYIELYDISGKLLKYSKLNTISLTNKGVVILKVYSKDGVKTKKLIL